MTFDKVTIKQLPDTYAQATGLAKHGKSKMPGTSEYLQVAQGPDGRYITGLDEDALYIKNIKDPEEKEAKYKEIKELREYLEDQTHEDLTARSKFWEDFGISLHSDQDLVLMGYNALDVVKYHALVANGYAAPDKEAGSRPEFLNSRFYAYVEARANQEEISTRKIRDKARAALVEVTEDEDKAIVIGQYLEGDKYKQRMNPSTVYKMLSDYIDNTKEPDNLKRFMKATKLSNEELMFKITVDRALRKKQIKLKDGYYQRGQVTLGKSLPQVYENLKKPEFAAEFLSIQEELEEA